MAGGTRRSRAASAKREQGLKKKASELSTLCGVDVCLLGVDPDGNFFFWPDDVSELRRIGRRYLDAVEGGDGGKAQRGKKRKRAEAGEPELLGCGVPPKMQERGSELDSTLETHDEREPEKAEGSVTDVSAPFAFTPSMAPSDASSDLCTGLDYAGEASSSYTMGSLPLPLVMHDPELLQAADIGWIGVPPVVPLNPPPFSAKLVCSSPPTGELGYGCDAEKLLLHLMGSPSLELGYGGDPEKLLMHLMGSPSVELGYGGDPEKLLLHLMGSPSQELGYGGDPEKLLMHLVGSPSLELGYGGDPEKLLLHLMGSPSLELDYGGDPEKLLLHLMGSPSQELPYDLEPLWAVDGCGAPQISADAYLPADSPASMPVGPPETDDDGGYGAALSACCPCPDRPVPFRGTDFGFLGDPAYDMDPAEAISRLPFFASSYCHCSAGPHFFMY